MHPLHATTDSEEARLIYKVMQTQNVLDTFAPKNAPKFKKLK